MSFAAVQTHSSSPQREDAWATDEIEFRRTLCWLTSLEAASLRGEIACGETAMKKVVDQSHESVGKGRVVAWAFIPKKCMGTVHFVPVEPCVQFGETGEKL